MKRPLAVATALLLSAASRLFAHRTDEYLQATTIALGSNRVHVEMRLIPGEAGLSIVLANIDSDANGVMSAAEQRAYAERVVRDLSLEIDDDRVVLWLASWTFPAIEEMKEGRGAIRLELDGDVLTSGHDRTLVFRNRHLPQIAAYLVNGLVPSDPDIRVVAQKRDYSQSSYQLDYVQSGVGGNGTSPDWSRAPWAWIGAASLLLLLPFGSWRHRKHAIEERQTDR
jgi:hypothetical protein